MFFLVVFTKKKFIQVQQTKRRAFTFKPVALKFGQYGLFFKDPAKFEFIYIFFIRKFCKRYGKKVPKKVLKTTKLWFNIRPNTTLTKKSKNARMGKGKGAFVRWIANLKGGVIFVECVGYPIQTMNWLSFKFQKKFKQRVGVLKNDICISDKSYFNKDLYKDSPCVEKMLLKGFL